MHRKSELPKIVFDQKHFTPLWMLEKDAGLLADKHLFAIRKLFGYLPTKIYFYTQLTPEPLYIQAYDQQTLELEKQRGAENIASGRWMRQLEMLSSQMYVKTKEAADEFFSKFYQREMDAIVSRPRAVISFLKKMQDIFSIIVPASFSTFPQCFSKIEEELLGQGDDDALFIAQYSTDLSYPLQLDEAILIYIGALRKAGTTNIADYNKKHPHHLKRLSSMMDRFGFLNWTEFGGEIVNMEYVTGRTEALLQDSTKFNEEMKKLRNVKEKIGKRNTLLQVRKNDRFYKIADRLGDISVMRLHMTIYVGCLQKYVTQFLSALTKYYQLPDEAIKMYEFSEILELIKTGKQIDKKRVEERKKGYLRIFQPKRSRIYCGGEARQRVRSLLGARKRDLGSTELQGTIASLPTDKHEKIMGRAFVLHSPFHTDKQIKGFQKGEILVAVQTHPQLVPQMKIAKAVVTDEGGLTCHAAIVSRELGIPCIIGTKLATKIFKKGDTLELDFQTGRVQRL